jgi:hypothetical protein
MPDKYRKRSPQVVEAIQWKGGDECLAEITRWSGGRVKLWFGTLDTLDVRSFEEGQVRVPVNHWVIKEGDNRFNAISDQDFADHYEKVS